MRPDPLDWEEAARVIARIAELAEAFADAAGVGGMETAGSIVSYLAAHPRRWMARDAMTDLLDDEDLFAVRPAPAAKESTPEPKPRRRVAVPRGEPYGPIYLVASFACPCGARDEVREPVPESPRCWRCKRIMARWTPPRSPPPGAGRTL